MINVSLAQLGRVRVCYLLVVFGGGQKAGNLIQVKGIMEKKQYDSILKIQAIPSGLRIIHLFQIMSKLPPVKKINIF